MQEIFVPMGNINLTEKQFILNLKNVHFLRESFNTTDYLFTYF